MPDPIPDDLQHRLARIADLVHRQETESERERRRLEAADDATLRDVLKNRAEPTAARANALLVLASRLRRDPALADVVLPLWDDPDEGLALAAIDVAPPFVAAVTARLRLLLDDERPQYRARAAQTLARRKDPAMLPMALGWFRLGDRADRYLALACLPWLLNPEEFRDLLIEAWEADSEDEEERAVLGVELLRREDSRGLDFLEGIAQRADSHFAVFAADSIHDHHEAASGLRLMAHILDHAPRYEVRWGMVERIARRAGLSHVWTADGLAEARHWVARSLEAWTSADEDEPTPVEGR